MWMTAWAIASRYLIRWVILRGTSGSRPDMKKRPIRKARPGGSRSLLIRDKSICTLRMALPSRFIFSTMKPAMKSQNSDDPVTQAGEFTHAHTMTTDSKGYIYIAETDIGRRIQRFKPVNVISAKSTAELLVNRTGICKHL